MSNIRNVSLFLGMLSSACFGMMRNQVQYDQEGFKVANGDEIKQVAYHNVSKDLMKIHKLNKVRDFLDHGGKIRVSQLDNGEYVLRGKVDGLGGGPGWAIATALIGYPLVGVAALGTLIATLPSGPGCVVAAAAVATGGVHLVTHVVVAVAVTPTP